MVLRSRRRVVLLGGLLGVLLASLAGSRPPRVSDEFSYLLAGETFASGRLTNPTHPMWRHFQSFHVIHEPTYSSKYPPAQGLLLASGIRTAGSPSVGVWLSCGLMVAALAWMLQAFVPPRWVLWGTVVASLWLVGSCTYWATSLWGGSLAAMGGALVLGGVRRLARAPTIGASLAVGVGLTVLANSRPFEGLLFSVVPMVVAGFVMLGQPRRGTWRAAITGTVPMLVVLAIASMLMAVHNEAVTGSVTEFPYQRYYRTYDSVPLLLGLPHPAPHAYDVPIMEQLYTQRDSLGEWYRYARTSWLEYLRLLPLYAITVVQSYASLVLLPVVVLPWIVRVKWARVALASLIATFVALLVLSDLWLPHYAAPAVGAMLLLLVTSVRFLSQLHRRGVRYGRSLARLVFAVIALSAALQLLAARLPVLAARLPGAYPAWPVEREKIQRQLAAEGRHFVLVEYGPSHVPNNEWVYNAPDIDASPVVWGHSLGARDSTFLRYFADRQGWRLRIDRDTGPFMLMPLER